MHRYVLKIFANLVRDLYVQCQLLVRRVRTDEIRLRRFHNEFTEVTVVDFKVNAALSVRALVGRLCRDVSVHEIQTLEPLLGRIFYV